MSNSVIVSPHHLSSGAGEKIFKLGGNAIDAAIAVNIVQGVVAPETCGIGGDLFALIWKDGEDQPYCLDSSGYAGTNVVDIDFSNLESLPLNHEATVTVPGAVKGWAEMHKKFGKLDFKILFEEAIKICNEGFEITHELNQSLTHHKEALIKLDSCDSFYLEGQPVQTGNIVTREKLGKTLSLIAENGPNIFYEGDIGEAISKATNNTLTIGNDIASAGTQVAMVTLTPHATVASSTTAIAGALTVAGATTFAGAIDMGSQATTNVNVDGGAIDGVTIGTNSAVTDLRVDNLKLDGNTVSSTDSNGDVNLTPNGSGNVVAYTDSVIVSATEGEAASFTLQTDEGDDNGDVWKIDNSTSNVLTFGNNASGSNVSHFQITPLISVIRVFRNFSESSVFVQCNCCRQHIISYKHNLVSPS